MPVAKGPELKVGRALIAGVVALGVGIVLVVIVTRLANSGDVEVRLGDEEFNAGIAEEIVESVDEGGPILYPDVAGGTRDILLNHIGDDPRRGWVAFWVGTGWASVSASSSTSSAARSSSTSSSNRLCCGLRPLASLRLPNR